MDSRLTSRRRVHYRRRLDWADLLACGTALVRSISWLNTATSSSSSHMTRAVKAAVNLSNSQRQRAVVRMREGCVGLLHGGEIVFQAKQRHTDHKTMRG